MEILWQIVKYLVLILAYLGLALGRLPRLRMNRATIALVGAAFLIGLNVLSLSNAWEAIDPNTIVFLISMMVVNANLSYAGFFQLTRRVKPEKVLRQVDWNLLVMFSGLFILTRATQNLGLLELLTPLADTPAKLLGVTVLLSNLISNVPAVLVLAPLIEKNDTASWLLLSAGSTLAGNLTLFGSVANLIVAEAAASLGYHLSFKEHLRFGLPLTAIALVIAYFGIL